VSFRSRAIRPGITGQRPGIASSQVALASYTEGQLSRPAARNSATQSEFLEVLRSLAMAQIAESGAATQRRGEEGPVAPDHPDLCWLGDGWEEHVDPAIGPLQLSFVEIVDWPVGSAFAVGEAKALVKGAGGHVVLAGAKIHVICAMLSGLVDRGFHQCTPQSLPTPAWNHVKLRQIALGAVTPDIRTETEHYQAVGAGSAHQDHCVGCAEQSPDSLGQHGRAGRGVVIFPVEIVKQLPDGVCVGGARAANGQIPSFCLAHVPNLWARATGFSQ